MKVVMKVVDEGSDEGFADRWIDRQTDICECRVAFATENCMILIFSTRDSYTMWFSVAKRL